MSRGCKISAERSSKRSENRAQNRELITAAAEELFLRNGFEKTSMDDVSKRAGFTKRTIYRYFLSKEDLFFAVALRGAYMLAAICEEAVGTGKNALEKIRLTNTAYLRFYIEHPDRFMLMNYLPENRRNCEASTSYRALGALKDEVIRQYMLMVDEGKADGSINANLDTKMAVYFGFCSTIGMLNTVAAMERSFFWQRDGLNPIEFLRFSLELYADALK